MRNNTLVSGNERVESSVQLNHGERIERAIFQQVAPQLL
jgi:hypothetical protein